MTDEKAVANRHLFEQIQNLPIGEYMNQLSPADLTVEGLQQVLRELGVDARLIAKYLLDCASQSRDMRVALKSVHLLAELVGMTGSSGRGGGVSLNQLFIASPQELESIVREGGAKLSKKVDAECSEP